MSKKGVEIFKLLPTMLLEDLRLFVNPSNTWSGFRLAPQLEDKAIVGFSNRSLFYHFWQQNGRLSGFVLCENALAKSLKEGSCLKWPAMNLRSLWLVSKLTSMTIEQCFQYSNVRPNPCRHLLLAPEPNKITPESNLFLRYLSRSQQFYPSEQF